jgi:hypothetical protein
MGVLPPLLPLLPDDLLPEDELLLRSNVLTGLELRESLEL